MAERRMFSKTIIDSDAFLDMPMSSQLLYFHLSMRADDDGFVGNPKRIIRMIGANDDDLKVLLTKRYLLAFDSGVVVIKHWRINNYLQNDRHKKTTYIEELNTLTLDNKNGYIEKGNNQCIQDVYTMYTQDSIGKDSINKVSKKEKKEDIYVEDVNTHAYTQESYDDIMTDLEVSEELKPSLQDFIRHCVLNKKTLTNDKLRNIIIRLDMNCQTEQEKIQSLRRAISGGYFDIAEGRD